MVQRKTRFVLASAIFASAAALSAHAGTVTFNGTVAQDGGQLNWGNSNITFYDEAGFRFTADAASQTFFLDNDINSDSFNVDDDYLFNQNSSMAFTITSVSGAAFTFESFRAGGVFGGTGVIVVEGMLQGGGSVFHTFDYVRGSNTGQAFPLIDLPDEFNAPLVSVTITRAQGNFAGFDDFVLNEVPAPAALGVFALGLVGAGRRRRRA